jgi:hypothetical protein
VTHDTQLERNNGSAGPTLPADAAERLAPICRRHRVQRLALFGSRLRGEHRADSDVDLLVAFEPDAAVTLLDMARIEAEMGVALAVADAAPWRVDLRTAADLSRHFRETVLREAQPLFPA